MTDRIVGALLFALAVAYGLAGRGYTSAFASGPLGPSAFPLLLAGFLGVTSLVLIFRPDPGAPLPHGLALAKQALAVLTLVAYAFVLEPVGFIPATAVAIVVLALQLGATTRNALILGIAMSVFLFALFDWVLGLPLPVGVLFGG